MPEITLIWTGVGFVPEIETEYTDNLKSGTVVKAKISKLRNPLFHRKFFALLKVGFDAWEPEVQYKGHDIQKNFERFRADCIILAGYYDVVPRLNNEPRIEAKSISFANMDENRLILTNPEFGTDTELKSIDELCRLDTVPALRKLLKEITEY